MKKLFVIITRESFHRRDFEGALEYCYYDDLSNGPYNNLMPVGKLRRFDVMLKSEQKDQEVISIKFVVFHFCFVLSVINSYMSSYNLSSYMSLSHSISNPYPLEFKSKNN